MLDNAACVRLGAASAKLNGPFMFVDETSGQAILVPGVSKTSSTKQFYRLDRDYPDGDWSDPVAKRILARGS